MIKNLLRRVFPAPTTRAARRTRRVRTALAAGITLFVLPMTMAMSCGSSGANSAQSAVTSGNSRAQAEYNEFANAGPYTYPFTTCASDGTGCKANPPSDPLELKNLRTRLLDYNTKGDTNYVYIQTYAGTVVGYYVIQGKVSSTGSEMTSTNQVTNCDNGSSGNTGSCTATDAIGDDGSFGPEEGGAAGVFFITASGNLIETDDPFIVSNVPIKLYGNVPNLDS